MSDIEGSQLLPPVRLSVAKRCKAKELFKQGLGYKAVAKKLGLNVYTVRDWGRQFRAGTFLTEHGSSATDKSKEKLKQILALHDQGNDERAIAVKMGLSVQTVRVHLRRMLMQAILQEGSPEPAKEGVRNQ